jgi:hypothetical protein
MKVGAGSLLPEGLLAENSAKLKAATRCEAYRIRQSDFRVAVGPHVDWRGPFLLLEKEAYKSCLARLKSAKAVCQLTRSRSLSQISSVYKPSASDLPKRGILHQKKMGGDTSHARTESAVRTSHMSTSKLPPLNSSNNRSNSCGRDSHAATVNLSTALANLKLRHAPPRARILRNKSTVF